MIVRRATMEDLSWLVMELDSFAAGYGTKIQLFGSIEYVVDLVTRLINEQVVLVSEDESGLRTGLIAGAMFSHPYNPKIRVLHESFWWVSEAHRKSGAGIMLMDEFKKIGKGRGADWILFSSIEGKDSIKDEFFIRHGFRLQEKSFIMEVV